TPLSQGHPRQLEEADHAGRVEVLDDLRAEDAPQGGLGEPGQVLEDVLPASVEGSLPTRRDHRLAHVHAVPRDTRTPQQVQELAASTAQVDHLSGQLAEEVQVGGLPPGHVLPRAPKAVLELQVVEV